MNEFIKQIQTQIIPPRSSESKTRRPFRSQVIDGALEEEEAQSSHWVRDTCDKSAHSIVTRGTDDAGIKR